VRADEVVMEEVDGDLCRMVLDFLAEALVNRVKRRMDIRIVRSGARRRTC